MAMAEAEAEAEAMAMAEVRVLLQIGYSHLLWRGLDCSEQAPLDPCCPPPPAQ